MHHFVHDDVDIAYVDVGTGDPVLLIHGFASNHTANWRSTGWIDTLTGDGRRVIAMDVRGHGASSKFYEPLQYRPALMAEDAANLLRHLGIARADVMGYSMGARVAALLAVAHPSLVRSLIIGGMGISLVNGIGGEKAISEALLAPSPENIANEQARGYRTFADRTKSDRRALAASILEQRQPVPASELAKIAAPTLIAVGTRDMVAGSARELAALIPGAIVADIPNRDHMLATGDKAYKAAVLDFLAKRP
jgi:pimeloyl-ACP methyl ester carboxylesterase